MQYTFKDIVLSQEEFLELKQCVGEFRRICRDQVYRYVGGEYEKSEDKESSRRLEIADNLVSIFDRIECLNNNTK